MVNQPVEDIEDAKSDFNGEKYCRNLNSPDFPAAYYCLNYKKGNRKWYLPSSGELWLIYRHLEEVQTALSIVGGQKFDTKTNWENYEVPCYWSSTEGRYGTFSWRLHLYLGGGSLAMWDGKVSGSYKVRPISKFQPSELKESFTKKISKKTNQELQDDADESILPKNYIELALMSVLCSAKKKESVSINPNSIIRMISEMSMN